MSVNAIVGAQWGDEGKGKLTDALAGRADVVVRFQGGNNAGHEVMNQYGHFVLSLLPAGVFHSHVLNVLGPGVAVNIDVLVRELNMLKSAGVPSPKLLISDRAQVVLPYHIALDELEEVRLGEASFGSTQNGIAPHYADKYLKVGIQVGDLFDRKRLSAQLKNALVSKNVLFKHLYNRRAIDLDALVVELFEQAQDIKAYVGDSHQVLQKALEQGQKILLEGQLGALRDPDHGIYPFSTSSSPLAGFASVGAGIPPHAISTVVAVVKGYSSCVGAGPFVGELFGSDGDELRAKGSGIGEKERNGMGEVRGYGADGKGNANGPPWRVGWFDAVATRYGCQLQGTTDVALTLIDVLGHLDQIPICVRYELDGKETDRFPRTADLERAKPVYDYVPGWKCDISGVRRYDDLPHATKKYVEYIERLIGFSVRWISVGPKRDQLIERKCLD